MGSTLKTTPEQSGSSAANSRAGPHVMSGRHLQSGHQTDNTHKIISNLNRIEINFRTNDIDSNFRMSDKVLNQIDEAMKDMAGDKPPDEHPDENEMALEYPEDDILMVDEGRQEDQVINDDDPNKDKMEVDPLELSKPEEAMEEDEVLNNNNNDGPEKIEIQKDEQSKEKVDESEQIEIQKDEQSKDKVDKNLDNDTTYETGSEDENESEAESVNTSTDDEIEHNIKFNVKEIDKETLTTLSFVSEETPGSIKVTKKELKKARKTMYKYIRRKDIPVRMKLTQIEHILSYRGRAILFKKNCQSGVSTNSQKRQKRWENIKQRYLRKGLNNSDTTKVETADVKVIKAFLKHNDKQEIKELKAKEKQLEKEIRKLERKSDKDKNVSKKLTRQN